MARKNNAEAAAMEAQAKLYAAAAKRATRLAIEENEARIVAENENKVAIAKAEAENEREKAEATEKFHLLGLAETADREATREWEMRN